MRKRIIRAQTGYRIVAIDDEIGIIDSLSVVLRKNGYDFTGFTDPIEAIESIRQEHYDILILDYLMNPIHGDKVVEKIREFNRDLYILLLTGHKDLAPPLETIKELDIQGYCEKSDKFEQLLLLVELGIKSIVHERTIRTFRNGLDRIVSSAPEIYQLQPPQEIIRRALPQVISFSNSNDIFVMVDDPLKLFDDEKESIFVGIGKYSSENNFFPDKLEPAIIEDIFKVRTTMQPVYKKDGTIILPLSIEYKESLGIIYIENSSIEGSDEILKLLEIFTNQISASLNNSFLHSVVNKKNEELNIAYEQLRTRYVDTIEVLRKAVDARDIYTRGHSDRVSYYAVEIGKILNLSDAELELLRVSGIFHDVGKIGISDDILLKAGKLTDEEYDEIKKHPLKGAQILSALSTFKEVIPIIKHHHERIDGKGYPFGLKGEEIPLYSRILSVADAFDAMMSDRHYRKKLTLDQAIEQLITGSGPQFDSIIVSKFIGLLSNYDKIAFESESSY